jgi:hypothetical protein
VVTEVGIALPEEPVYKAYPEGHAPPAPPLGPHLREAINLVQALEPPASTFGGAGGDAV